MSNIRNNFHTFIAPPSKKQYNERRIFTKHNTESGQKMLKTAYPSDSDIAYQNKDITSKILAEGMKEKS